MDDTERVKHLVTAIRRHRAATKCCDECAADLTSRRSTPDGRLWAVGEDMADG